MQKLGWAVFLSNLLAGIVFLALAALEVWDLLRYGAFVVTEKQVLNVLVITFRDRVWLDWLPTVTHVVLALAYLVIACASLPGGPTPAPTPKNPAGGD